MAEPVEDSDDATIAAFMRKKRASDQSEIPPATSFEDPAPTEIVHLDKPPSEASSPHDAGTQSEDLEEAVIEEIAVAHIAESEEHVSPVRDNTFSPTSEGYNTPPPVQRVVGIWTSPSLHLCVVMDNLSYFFNFDF